MPVSGENILMGTFIKRIIDTQSIELTQNAFEGDTEITASLPYQSVTTKLGSSQISVDANLVAEWRRGAVLRTSSPFLAGTKILELSRDGRVVRVSKPARATGESSLQVNTEYLVGLSLSKSLVIDSPQFSSGVAVAASTGSLDKLEVEANGVPAAVGTVQWSAQVLSNGEFSLRGNVNSGVTGQLVGQLWFEGDSRPYKIGEAQDVSLIRFFPTNLISKLNDEAPTVSYWDSIPSCDIQTAAQKQGVIDALTQQNQYQNFFRP
jgi:hypothetical protein